MSSSPTQRAGAVLITLVILVGAVWYMGVPMWEQSRAEAVKAAMAALPDPITAEKVEVSLVKRSLTLTKVKGRVLLGPTSPVDFTASRMVLSGVPLFPSNQPGLVKIAETFACSDFEAAFGSGEGASKRSASFQTETADGLWVDWGRLTLAIEKKSREEMQAVIHTMKAGPSKYTGYASSLGEKGKITASNMEFGTSSLYGVEDGVYRDLHIIIDDKTIMTADRLLVKRLCIPLFAYDASVMEQFGANPLSLLDRLAEDPIVIDGLVLEKLRVSGNGQTSEAAEARFTFRFGKADLAFELGVKDAVVPQSLYGGFSREWGAFAKSYNAPLNISADLFLHFEPKNDAVILAMGGKLVDPALGRFSAVINGSGRPASVAVALPVGPATLAFTGGRLEKEDKALASTFFEAVALDLRGKGKNEPAVTAQMAREEIQKLITTQVVSRYPSLTTTWQTLAKSLEQPGLMVVNLNPPTPVGMLEFFNMIEAKRVAPDRLGLTVSFTPAGQ